MEDCYLSASLSKQQVKEKVKGTQEVERTDRKKKEQARFWIHCRDGAPCQNIAMTVWDV